MKLAELLVQLDQANFDLKEAASRTSAAQSDETIARNHVNELQKEIDAQIAALRGNAGWQTDWHTAARRTSGDERG